MNAARETLWQNLGNCCMNSSFLCVCPQLGKARPFIRHCHKCCFKGICGTATPMAPYLSQGMCQSDRGAGHLSVLVSSILVSSVSFRNFSELLPGEWELPQFLRLIESQFHSPLINHWLKRLSLFHRVAFAPLSQISWLYLWGSLSGLSVLLDWSVCLVFPIPWLL